MLAPLRYRSKEKNTHSNYTQVGATVSIHAQLLLSYLPLPLLKQNKCVVHRVEKDLAFL